MKTNTRQAIKGLADVRQKALRGAEQGLAAVCPALGVELRGTDAHGDQSGATRAGYTAGVTGPTLDTLTPAISRSAADVARLNPGHAKVESIGEAGQSVVVVLTSPTDYQEHLSFNNAGARDALGPTLTRNAGRLTQAAAEGIRRELG